LSYRLFLAKALACLFFAYVFFASSLAQANSDLLNKINSDLSNGHIVVVYQMLNNDTASEQYADWAYYLNEFAASNAPLYKFYSVDAAFNNRLSKCKLDITGSFTLFLKKDAPSFFYSGVVVENLVYLAVKAHYAQEELLPGYRAFMPDEVTITRD